MRKSVGKIFSLVLIYSLLILQFGECVEEKQIKSSLSWYELLKSAPNFEVLSNKLLDTGRNLQKLANDAVKSLFETTTKDTTEDGLEAMDVVFQNDSPYRVSVFWDDDENWQRVVNLIAPGDSVKMSTYAGHVFHFTREGTRESIGDPVFIQNSVHSYVLPKDAESSEDDCKDRYAKKCPEWARSNECTKNPGWMIVNCPVACEACQLLDPEKRCDPNFLNVSSDPIWKPGELDLMFERIIKDMSDRFDIEVIGRPPEKPWLLQFNSFLTGEEVDRLLEWGKKLGYERSTDTGQPNDRGEVTKIFSTGRTSSNAWCTGGCEKDPLVHAVSDRIVEINRVPYEYYEQFQLLQYELGQQYKPHHDMSPKVDKRAGGVRILTFFLYLSDVEEGGETEFPKLNIKVKPKKGRAILWPSVLNDDPMAQDPRTIHAALPVIRGKKYAANHWIHSHDFKTANKWGCTGSFD